LKAEADEKKLESQAKAAVAQPAAESAPQETAEPKPAAVSKLSPKRTFDLGGPETAGEPEPVPAFDIPSLAVPANESFFSRIPAIVKIAAIVVLVAGLGGAIYFGTSGRSSAKPVAAKSVETLVPGPLVGDTGWSNDWAGEAASRRGRQIALYRASQNVADYRFDIQAQIESRALGWVFRAKNPQNYHVAKLEVLKPGLNPTVALIRFSVIDGEESARTQIPLPMPVRVDTLYRVRTEASGDRFSIWVNDQLIQQWSDDRIRVGGVGLYTEKNERASVRNVAVTQMVPKH
jgi:hypothetical protein